MLSIIIRYSGTPENLAGFARDMRERGIVDRIRAEEGNIRYEYLKPLEDPNTLVLLDAWENQEALDVHHESPMMQDIIELREKYDLRMSVERYYSADDMPESDKQFIRK